MTSVSIHAVGDGAVPPNHRCRSASAGHTHHVKSHVSRESVGRAALGATGVMIAWLVVSFAIQDQGVVTASPARWPVDSDGSPSRC